MPSKIALARYCSGEFPINKSPKLNPASGNPMPNGLVQLRNKAFLSYKVRVSVVVTLMGLYHLNTAECKTRLHSN